LYSTPVFLRLYTSDLQITLAGLKKKSL